MVLSGYLVLQNSTKTVFSHHVCSLRDPYHFDHDKGLLKGFRVLV